MEASELLIPCMDAALQYGASDLHFVAGKAPCLSLDGDMVPIDSVQPLTEEGTKAVLDCIVTDAEAQAVLKKQGYVDFRYRYQGRSFRVNAASELKGYAITLRVIPDKVPSPEKIGLNSTIMELVRRPQGLFLVTGVTGSGKSTTLAAILQHLANTELRKIITVEQPIEYVLAHGTSIVTQFDVPTHVTSFADALRSGLRQAPNIILVGELRDPETMETALHAAETGHRVFATVHSKSAHETPDRIIEGMPAELQNQTRVSLASCLLGVMTQVLVKKPQGGRVLAYEFMVNTPAIANLIRTGKRDQMRSYLQTGREEGMQVLEDHLAELVAKGEADRESALEKARDPDSFKRRLTELSGE